MEGAGRAMCDAPVYVNENGILLFKYRMARGTCYWYFSREGDLSRSDGDFYRVKSDLRMRPPLEGWTFEACPLGRQTQARRVSGPLRVTPSPDGVPAANYHHSPMKPGANLDVLWRRRGGVDR
eukprot:s1384_g7.t1